MTIRMRTPSWTVVLTLVAAASASAQGAPSADPAKRGRSLWNTRGCTACHGIGKKATGPDLAGITKRRSRDWLMRFMTNTDQMLANDPAAIALLKEWKGVRMPQAKVTEGDVEAILAYVEAAESKPKQ